MEKPLKLNIAELKDVEKCNAIHIYLNVYRLFGLSRGKGATIANKQTPFLLSHFINSRSTLLLCAILNTNILQERQM